jgi:uncharacterized protein
MSIEPRLLELLVCPACKGPLTPVHQQGRLSALACPADHLAFPIRDGMPVMLESEATAYDGDKPDAVDPAPFGPTS